MQKGIKTRLACFVYNVYATLKIASYVEHACHYVYISLPDYMILYLCENVVHDNNVEGVEISGSIEFSAL